MTDNSADRNKQGCVHPHQENAPFGRGALGGQLEPEWNRNENRGHGQQSPLTSGTLSRLSVPPTTAPSSNTSCFCTKQDFDCKLRDSGALSDA